MGSLERRKKSSFILTAVAALVLVGLLSPPARAGTSIEQRKIHLLELLGLDGTDPAVIQAAQQAYTLYAVDVVPGDSEVSVVIQLSGMPAYDSYLLNDRRRLVLDLRDTLNLSPSPVFTLGEEDPVRKVRNSQYRVKPSFISRVVIELAENETPDIRVEGNNIVITTSAVTATQPSAGVEAKPAETILKEKEVRSEVVPVPAVKVATETPQVDFMLAQNTAATPEAAAEQEEPAETPEMAPEEEPAEIPSEIEGNLEEEEAEPMVAEEPEEAMEMAPEAAEEMETPTALEPAGEVPIAEAEALPEERAVERPTGKTADTMQPLPVTEQLVEQPLEQVPHKITATPAAKLAAAPEPEPAYPSSKPETNEIDATRVTLTFRDAEIGSVLEILARKGNLNILAGKDVKGTVTVRLVDVPFDVALNAVLSVNGYGYIQTDNIIRVLPLAQMGKTVETVTETYVLSYAEAQNAKQTLTGLLTANGKIDTDKRTNMLIITDIPANMDRIRQLIPQIDKRVQQVLIEVLILDSVLSDAADLGIQWNLEDSEDNSFFEIGDRSNPDTFGVTLPFRTQTGLDVSFGTLIGDLKLNVLIQALVDNTDSRILANPKILTVDNESASIEIIEEFPYSDVTQTSAGGQLSNITFKEIGTKLEVRPQITHDEHVILWLTPEQNSIAGGTVTGVPIVDTRRAETTLIVKNHQTIVLGGLRENRKVKSITKVPLLGDLPGVKYVFRNVSDQNRDTELLVFLTVHIVEAPPLLPNQKIKFEELANLPRKPDVSIDLIR